MGIHKKHHHEWIDLYINGYSCDEIASMYDMKYPGTVWKVLSRKNIPRRPHKEKEKHKEYINLYPEWIQLYQDGKTTGEIGEMFGLDHAFIWAALKKNGVPILPIRDQGRISRFRDDHDDWINMYLDGLSSREIANKYKTHSGTVVKLLKNRGIKIRNNCESNHKRSVGNKFAFDIIDTQEKAYWLGFFSADGCVKERKAEDLRSCYGARIGLARTDAGHLLKLSEFLKVTTIDGRDVLLEENEGRAVRLNIPSKEIALGLIKHNCVPNKTLGLQFPKDKINPIFYRHYIRGYFDGDGCIASGKQHKNGHCVMHAIFTSGSPDFLRSLQNVLTSDISIQSTTLYRQKNSNAYHLTIGRKEYIQNLYHYFYDDSTMWLERKRIKFEKLLRQNELL